VSDVRVRRADVLAMRLFDIAYEIDLALAEYLSAEAGGRRGRLTSAPEKSIAFDVPPVQIQLGEVDVPGLAGRAIAVARLYDFGVVALTLRVPFAGGEWSAFSDAVEMVQRTCGVDAASAPWTALLERVTTTCSAALRRPVATTSARLQEDYLVALVHELDAPLDAVALKASVDLAALLSGERRALAPAERAERLRQSFSYFEDDLVVLGWDRAFVYEPGGHPDVVDVIEVANAQLLELRCYDTLLDEELPRMYDQVEAARRGARSFAAPRFARLARSLYTLVAEVTELTEKVDNALQVTEDVYLARIYASALELFRVPRIGAAVDRKLAIIRDTYTALYEEASSSRAELLEIAIVVLILIEILLGLARL
jgi:hypothetical protein